MRLVGVGGDGVVEMGREAKQHQGVRHETKETILDYLVLSSLQLTLVPAAIWP